MALGPGGHGHSSAQVALFRSVNNSIVLDQRLQELFRVSVAPPGPAARDQDMHQWWPELVVCTHLTVGARAGSKGRGQLQAHWPLWGPGSWFALPGDCWFSPQVYASGGQC